jgi:hypothetical protein
VSKLIYPDFRRRNTAAQFSTQRFPTSPHLLVVDEGRSSLGPEAATGQPPIVMKETIESNDDDPNLPIELDSSPCDA